MFYNRCTFGQHIYLLNVTFTCAFSRDLSRFKCPFGLARYVAFLHRQNPSLLPGHSQSSPLARGHVPAPLGSACPGRASVRRSLRRRCRTRGVVDGQSVVGAARGVFLVRTVSADDNFAAVTQTSSSSSSSSHVCHGNLTYG